MKKTTILSWLIVCALLLVGCNSQHSPPSTETSPTEPMPTGSATGDAEPFIPSFMQDTQKPTETTPPQPQLQPQPEITWDQTKYKVTINSPAMETSYFGDELSVISSGICYNKEHEEALPECFSLTETVEMLGELYSGTFDRAYCRNGCNDKRYGYSGETESGEKFNFSLDKDKNLIYFSVIKNTKENSQNPITRIEAVRLAKSFYTEITGEDLDKLGFQISVREEKISGDPSLFLNYEVKACLIKEGIIFETVIIDISPEGELVYFGAVNRFRNRQADVSDVDFDELKGVFDQVYEYIDLLKPQEYTAEDIYFYMSNEDTISFERVVYWVDGWMISFTIIIEPIL